jgi:hypothetical protein
MTTKQHNTQEHAVLLAYNPRCLCLNILRVLPLNISWGTVVTYVITRRSIAGRKDRPGGTGCDCTTKLGSRLPDNLRKVRRLRVVGIIRASFIRPHFDGARNRHVSGTGGKILTSSRVLENAFICPCLGCGRQLVAPSERVGPMLGPDSVVGIEISLLVSRRYGA